MRDQRRAIQMLLDDSPSLRAVVGSVIEKVSGGAREAAAALLADRGEVPRVDLALLGYTEDQVPGSWLP